MITQIKTMVIALTLFWGFAHAAAPDESLSWHDKVKGVFDRIFDTIDAAKQNLEENSTLITEAMEYYEEHSKFGEYEYLFRPKDHRENIGNLKFEACVNNCGNRIGVYAREVLSHTDSEQDPNSKSEKASILHVEDSAAYLESEILSDMVPLPAKEVALFGFIDKTLRLLLRRFADNIYVLSQINDEIDKIQSTKFFANKKSLASELCDTPLTCSIGPGLVCPMVPVLGSFFDPLTQESLYLRLPPIFHQNLIYSDIFAEMLLEILRLVNKLSKLDVGFDNLQIPSRFIFEDDGQGYTFDLSVWRTYFDDPGDPVLEDELIEPYPWYRQFKDLYPLIVETQREGFLRVLAEVKKCNTSRALGSKRGANRTQALLGYEAKPEDPATFARILAQFPKEKTPADARNKAPKKKKHKKRFSKPLSANRRKKTDVWARKARKTRELAAALAEVSSKAYRFNDDDTEVKEAVPHKKFVNHAKPAKTKRADRDTSRKKANSQKTLEKQTREKNVTLYAGTFHNFADLPPLSRHTQAFFEILYDAQTRLINYDDLVKFAKLAGINVENRSGSIRIFSWTDPVTHIKFVKRFDEPHLKNNNERKYSSYVIGIAREFFSALRPVSPYRIFGFASSVDQKHFRSNMMRFIQE